MLVRVRLPSGWETSVNHDYAAAQGLEVLDQPATNIRGALPATRKNGRRAKRKTTVNEAAAKKAAASTTTASSTVSNNIGGVAAGSPEEGK
jgi:hypothetical protein